MKIADAIVRGEVKLAKQSVGEGGGRWALELTAKR
jgi:hypothetical protein